MNRRENRRENRRFLQRQVLEMERLRPLVAGHPLMEPLLAQREAEARAEQDAIGAVDHPEARTVLFFSGRPVVGSQAVDAQFVAQVLPPFLDMVKSQYAAAKFGTVGQRGPVRSEDEARLLLAGTPRGSFGLELRAPYVEDMFAEERLGEVLVQVTRLLEASTESDEEFLLSLDDVAPRTFGRLPDFFKVLRDAGAGLRIQAGDLEVSLPGERIERAYSRTSTVKATEQTVRMPGIFRGATLDSGRFDFRTEDGETISGRVGPDVTQEALTAMLRRANQLCVAVLGEIQIETAGGVTRTRYTLLDLEDPKEATLAPPTEPPPAGAVSDLMEMLRRSLEATQSENPAEAESEAGAPETRIPAPESTERQ